MTTYHRKGELQTSSRKLELTEHYGKYSVSRIGKNSQVICSYKAWWYTQKMSQMITFDLAVKVSLTKYDSQGNQVYWVPGTFLVLEPWEFRRDIIKAIRNALRENHYTIRHGLLDWWRMRKDVTNDLVQACFDPLIEQIREERAHRA